MFLDWPVGLMAEPVRPVLPPVRQPVSPWLVMNRRAGLIFSGRVLRVQRKPSTHLRDLETIEITFHVDDAIRGVRPGQTLSIREWAGLWIARPRYRVGERVVLFLYPPSRIGLTSTVSNERGRFVVSPRGAVRFSPEQSRGTSEGDVLHDRAQQEMPLTEFLRQVRDATGGRP
jgi:hypothetical protein